jgi:plastocyanin
MRRLRTVILTLSVLGLAASTASAATVDVTVGANSAPRFNASSVTINPGDTVHWAWASSNHSVTAGALAPTSNGQFDSGVKSSGGSFDQTFAHPGVFRYFCKVHYLEGMSGTITVTGNAPPPKPAFTPTLPSPGTFEEDTFDASGSTAPNGYTIQSYTWNFDDGTPPQTTADPVISHTWQLAGKRNVGLTVTTSGSATASTERDYQPRRHRPLAVYRRQPFGDERRPAASR